MKKKLPICVSIVTLLLYVIVENPSFTSIGVHEWLGIGLFFVLVLHCALCFQWSKNAATRPRPRPRPRPRIKPTVARLGPQFLSVMLIVVFMIVVVSGLGISGSVLATFGLYSEGYFFWYPLHAISAKILLALFLVHLVVHGKWIRKLFKAPKSDEKTAQGTRGNDE